MSKAEKTRAFIIQTSAPIFNKKGYAATSLQDLTAATGLTKGSIYGNFENKDEVAVAVYNYNIQVLNRRISEFLRDKTKPLDKLTGLADFYRKNWKTIFEKGGCPIQNASVEADDHLSILKKPVQNSIKSWVRGISGIIKEGQHLGDFKKNIVAKDYAYTLLTYLEGGIMLAKIMNDQKLLFSALDRMDQLIHTEIKNKNHL